ncbi:MAG: glycogen/starch/alpha-glucan family phosphorylase [Verrucomicrobia bacterium]|nr:glycogen/starch/alpha-glucan family phosphorylase [Verrucomicrobiota bacterium]
MHTDIDRIVHKVGEYLLSNIGRSLHEATDEEVYRALAHTLRDEIMVNYLATERTFEKHDARRLYYLSMEYLPGRFLLNNLNNIAQLDVVKGALQKMNRKLDSIILQENDPGIGSGGLGRLASCLMDSLATLHYPAMGYGLRYQYGTFEQQIVAGRQIEAPDCWLMHENPWEIRQELERATVKYHGHTKVIKSFQGDPVETLHDHEEVWAMPYDIPIVGYDPSSKFTCLPLRLWSTKESPRNFQLQRYNAGKIDQAAENMIISDVLYPNELNETGKRIRLKQEFLLVSASLQDIIRRYLLSHDTFNDFSDKVRIQINDTHPALLIAELIRCLTKDHNTPWKRALEITQNVTSYTNHTVMKEALEEWDNGLMKQLLPRQFRVIEQLNHEFLENVRSRYPGDHDLVRDVSIIEHGHVHMANLSIVGSHKVNGVSNLHTEILKNSAFKDFYKLFPDKFVNITNGVTHRLWLLHTNPLLAEFVTKRIGNGWITDFRQIEKLAAFSKDPESQADFWAIRKKNKERFIRGIKQFCKNTLFIESDALFDVQIKRIHEYKRQLMNALHILMLYFDLSENPGSRIKRSCIFAGKTAAGYETAKNIIRLIFAIGKKISLDPNIRHLLQVSYVENYNVSKAQLIIPAADISEQISTAGTEASGTSVMKFAMNGALTVGTHDGANVEISEAVTDAWWPFRFGLRTEEIATKPFTHIDNPKIRRALDSLRDGSLASNEEEHFAFCGLYNTLLHDSYYVLHDLQSFYEVQLKVEELFKNPMLWATYAIHNMASMGSFSTDVCIKNYSDLIWNLTPCPIDNTILEKLRQG